MRKYTKSAFSIPKGDIAMSDCWEDYGEGMMETSNSRKSKEQKRAVLCLADKLQGAGIISGICGIKSMAHHIVENNQQKDYNEP